MCAYTGALHVLISTTQTALFQQNDCIHPYPNTTKHDNLIGWNYDIIWGACCSLWSSNECHPPLIAGCTLLYNWGFLFTGLDYLNGLLDSHKLPFSQCRTVAHSAVNTTHMNSSVYALTVGTQYRLGDQTDNNCYREYICKSLSSQ